MEQYDKKIINKNMYMYFNDFKFCTNIDVHMFDLRFYFMTNLEIKFIQIFYII